MLADAIVPAYERALAGPGICGCAVLLTDSITYRKETLQGCIFTASVAVLVINRLKKEEAKAQYSVMTVAAQRLALCC